MASKIQGHNFYVAITPYNVQGVEDQYNELSVFTNYNDYTHQFYVSLHAGWKSTFGHGSIIMGDSNPLTASTRVYVKESPRNSQKTINEIGAALELAKTDIAWLFDERMWPELRQFVKDVALCGYNENLKSQISNLKLQKNTTMEKTVKAADLIGKTIVVGDNQATIVIKGVDGDKLSAEFTKDGKATPMSFPLSQLKGMTEKGLWKISLTPDPSPKGKGSEVTTEADVAEVEDIVPVVTPKEKSDGGSKTADVPQPIPADEEPAPIKVKLKTNAKTKAKTQPSAVNPQPSTFKYETYTTSKGKTGAKITGVSETDAAYQQASAIHASASYERDKDGNKQFYLCFGPRYAEAAKQVCEALNAGKPIEDAIAIIDKATEERATKREEWKQKREERKAQTSALSTQTSEKFYTQSELAEWLRKLNAGDPTAAKFFNDLAKAA